MQVNLQVEESKVDEEIVLDDDIQKDSEDGKLGRIELDDVNAGEEETRPEEAKQHEKEELSRISRSSYEREKEEESKMVGWLAKFEQEWINSGVDTTRYDARGRFCCVSYYYYYF